MNAFVYYELKSALALSSKIFFRRLYQRLTA